MYKFNENKVFFTSDTHFGHENIIKFCKRPFLNVDDMNEALIENWNEVVPKDGIVFHLGDFAFGGSNVWNEILPRLNGQIYLILGNHDRKNIRQGFMKHFVAVEAQMQIEIEGRSIYLNHYPFLCYGGSWRNEKDAVWQLFGHVHSGPAQDVGMDNGRLSVLFPTQYDVGVDNNNYAPVSYKKIKQIIHERCSQ